MSDAKHIWSVLEGALERLEQVPPSLRCTPTIYLGNVLPEETVRELAKVSGGALSVYRSRGDDSIERVHCDFSARRARVEVYGSSARPATAADAHLPMRGGR